MTPARRRRLFRTIIVLTAVMVASFISRLFLDSGVSFDQKIAALLMGRKPGSARPGTVLVRTPSLGVTNDTLRPVAPPDGNSLDGATPMKLKFAALGGWKYIEGKTPVPDDVQKLDGKLVEITGFMLPVNETQNITRFIVIQSLWDCCFGQTPAVNHIIAVTMEQGRSVEFCPDLVTVTGKFSVGETREEGYLVSIFRLEGKSVVVH